MCDQIRYIYLNSIYRKDKSQPHHDFTIDLAQQIKIKKWVKFEFCSISFDEFLINKTNNTFYIKMQTALQAQLVTIPENNNYDNNSLAAILQTLLQAIDGTFSVTYKLNNSQYVIQCAQQFQIDFSQNQLCYILGFEQQQYQSTLGKLVSQLSAQQNLPNELIIHIPEIQKFDAYQLSELSNSKITFLVQNDQMRNGIIQMTQKDITYILQLSDVQTEKLTVKLLEQNGDYFQTNSPVSICLSYV